ncbi:MAG: DUF4233 domain-containing protein [Jatrophihabitantaceae bacterium]
MTVGSEPTEEQIAERAFRANRATRGALAGVLGLEALVTLLLPRAIAFSSTGLGLTRTLILVGLAVVLIVGAAMVRRPFGIALGSALQVLFVLTGFLLVAMFFVGVIFAAIWGALLRIRRDLVGTPGGWRMLVS